MLFLDVPAEFTFWKNIFPLLTNVTTGGIVIFFLKKKIDAMASQIDALKTQVESQQGILNTTKTYFEIFDIAKLKEYAGITEEKAKMEARLSHQAELDALKEQDLVKKASLDAALKAASDSSERLVLLQEALKESNQQNIQLQMAAVNSVDREGEAANQLRILKTELFVLRQANAQHSTAINRKTILADIGITYIRYESIKQPPIPASISAVVTAEEVYSLLVMHPFYLLSQGTTIDEVQSDLIARHPDSEEASSPQAYQYIVQMAAAIMGENIWNANVY